MPFGNCGFEVNDGCISGYTHGFQIGVANNFKMHVVIKTDAESVIKRDKCIHIALDRDIARCELDAAAQVASLTASIACTRKGAQPSIPTRAEVEEFIKNNL